MSRNKQEIELAFDYTFSKTITLNGKKMQLDTDLRILGTGYFDPQYEDDMPPCHPMPFYWAEVDAILFRGQDIKEVLEAFGSDLSAIEEEAVRETIKLFHEMRGTAA